MVIYQGGMNAPPPLKCNPAHVFWPPQAEDDVLSRVMKETQERIRLFEESQRRWQDQQQSQHMQSPPPLTQVRAVTSGNIHCNVGCSNMALYPFLFLGCSHILNKINVAFTSMEWRSRKRLHRRLEHIFCIVKTSAEIQNLQVGVQEDLLFFVSCTGWQEY